MAFDIEGLMYLVSGVFLYPVLILLTILFCYTFVALGSFLFEALQRRWNKEGFNQVLGANKKEFRKHKNVNLQGYPLAKLYRGNPHIHKDELDVSALRLLTRVRSVSRLAPMLGLVATMIPMGPALKSLADGNIQGISENLIVAFSAVIIGLIIASITFWIASVKRTWLASDLVEIMASQEELSRQVYKEGRTREAA